MIANNLKCIAFTQSIRMFSIYPILGYRIAGCLTGMSTLTFSAKPQIAENNIAQQIGNITIPCCWTRRRHRMKQQKAKANFLGILTKEIWRENATLQIQHGCGMCCRWFETAEQLKETTWISKSKDNLSQPFGKVHCETKHQFPHPI